MSVSEQGLTALPAPGTYRNGAERYEVRHSKRDRWYAMRLLPDGTSAYVAQHVDPAGMEGPSGPGLEQSERQPSGCHEPNCPLPVWHRGLCGMHLAADAVRRAKAA